jgi:hypothetical protein
MVINDVAQILPADGGDFVASCLEMGKSLPDENLPNGFSSAPICIATFQKKSFSPETTSPKNVLLEQF